MATERERSVGGSEAENRSTLPNAQTIDKDTERESSMHITSNSPSLSMKETPDHTMENAMVGGQTERQGHPNLTIDLPPSAYTLLVSLSQALNETPGEVIHQGILLVGEAVRAQLAGKKFGVAAKNQQLDKEIVGLIEHTPK